MIGPRHFLLGGIALFALTGVATAADVPVKGPVYTKAAPAWSWEGQYIGIHGGYAWGENDASVAGLGLLFEPRGGYGGLQFGYLHHLSRNWVIGYEVDVSFGDINAAIGAFTNDINVFGTARARLGYAQGPWLFYATGGLAWARTELNIPVAGVSLERVQIGYAIGAGVEYAFAPNWSARVEYLYADLGDTNGIAAIANSTDLTMHTVRLGVNYRFANWSAANVVPAFPTKAPVRVAGWAGPYIGIHGGYGWGAFESTASVAPFTLAYIEPTGGFFGIQSGYNWQLSRNWVFGLESDTSWGSIKRTLGPQNVDIDAIGTVRARFGYAAGNALLYATGGLAWIHADTTVVAGALVRDQFYLGWTVGAGAELALSAKWSAKLEYLYSDFSSTDILPPNTFRDDFSIHTIKLGLNYRASVFELIGWR